ncbi:MAG TPA: two-component regulator propeller domain-containing protein, partial [Flavobacteriales bacterium]|nr:two-component regulator propeller domain-containing protein [Flavobacteriales bacterium]
MLSKKNFILSIWLFTALPVFAQQFIKKTGEHNFHNYSVRDGLVNSVVENVMQDSRGNLWVGTHGGLSIFNGTSFENFTTTEGLPNNYISWVTEGPDGRMWLATHNGTCVYDGKKFITYNIKNGLYHNQCWRVLFDKKGNLYIATSGGINIMRKNGNIEPFIQLETKNNDPGTSVIRGLFMDKDENLWFSTNSEVFMRKKNTSENIRICDGQVFDYLQDKDGTVWFCSWGGVLSSWKNGNLKQTGTGTPINSIHPDKEGNIWLATWDRGIWKYDRKDFYIYMSDNGLGINSVWGLTVDSEGNIWGGTFGAGLSCLKNQTFTTYSAKSGLINNSVSSMCMAPNGKLWIAADGGISKFDPVQGTFLNFTEKDGIYNTKLMGITAERNGTIWATLYSGPKFIKIVDDKIERNAPAGGGFGMYTDAHDTIWWGTDGAGAYGMKDGKITHVSFEPQHNLNRIMGFAEDNEQNLWFVPYLGGLHVRTKQGKVIWFGKKNGLTNETVNGPVSDHKNTLWMFWGHYLYACKFENDKIVFSDSLSVKNYFGNKRIGGILFDTQTNALWITTVNVLYRLNLDRYYNKHEVTFRIYTKDQGYPGDECAGILKTPDGTLWICTRSGLISYDKRYDVTNKIPPYIN